MEALIINDLGVIENPKNLHFPYKGFSLSIEFVQNPADEKWYGAIKLNVIRDSFASAITFDSRFYVPDSFEDQNDCVAFYLKNAQFELIKIKKRHSNLKFSFQLDDFIKFLRRKQEKYMMASLF